MARIVKQHTVRRGELVDTAQRLVYSKGYELMTIQDILEELRISKGAFYHYFGSKEALLEAVIERMVDEVEPLLLPIVHDPRLTAIEKLQRFFDTAATWKTAHKEFLLALMRVWYGDDNAIVRQKQLDAALKRIPPLLGVVLRQGVAEGSFTTRYPDEVGQVVLSLLQSAGDSLARLILSHEPERGDLQRMEASVAVHADALERVLGAPSGSLKLVDLELLKDWIDSARGEGRAG